MKRIIKGKLYDTALAIEVADKPIDIEVAPGVKASAYRKLYREVVLKPGVLLSDARTKTSWGSYTWNSDAIDFRRGEFFFVLGCGWNEQSMSPVDENSAREWFEEHFGGDIKTYEKYFGVPQITLQGSQGLTEFEAKLRERDIELNKLHKELEELKQEKESSSEY